MFTSKDIRFSGNESCSEHDYRCTKYSFGIGLFSKLWVVIKGTEPIEQTWEISSSQNSHILEKHPRLQYLVQAYLILEFKYWSKFQGTTYIQVEHRSAH